ncbi:unnamed protein product [Gadus morhua 'NCC']
MSERACVLWVPSCEFQCAYGGGELEAVCVCAHCKVVIVPEAVEASTHLAFVYISTSRLVKTRIVSQRIYINIYSLYIHTPLSTVLLVNWEEQRLTRVQSDLGVAAGHHLWRSPVEMPQGSASHISLLYISLLFNQMHNAQNHFIPNSKHTHFDHHRGVHACWL